MESKGPELQVDRDLRPDIENPVRNEKPVRNLGAFNIICAGCNICSSWPGIGTSLALAIGHGGSATMIYGIITVFIFVGASAATLAEIASVYPTAGGQYHWTSIMAPASINRGLSYCCGAINVFGWISITAAVMVILPQLILAIAVFNYENYVPEDWHIFVLYQSLNIAVLLYNIFALKRTTWVHNLGFGITVVAFFVIIITCIVRTQNYQSSEFVWATFTNVSGWKSNGVVFLTGLVSPNYMFDGLDGAVHLAEECSNAARAVPLALMSTVIIGFVTALAFTVTMLYCVSDFVAVVNTPTKVPIYEMWYQATQSGSAATIFMVLLFLAALIGCNGCQQTSSRLTWSFANDNALWGSRWIGRMHRSLDVPVNALTVNSIVVFLMGCVYMASTTAFTAFIGTALILQQLSFAIPAALIMYRKRSTEWLPASRLFKLPNLVGWVANFFTVAFAVVVIIFYDFPVVKPVTSGNMNYTSVVLGCMAVFAGLNWLFYARHHYHGPRLEGYLASDL